MRASQKARESTINDFPENYFHIEKMNIYGIYDQKFQSQQHIK